MCGFCHAPEHAYDVLLEHPEIERDGIGVGPQNGAEKAWPAGHDGLCDEAQQRLFMAATPRPPGLNICHYAWDEEEHAWRIAYGIHRCLLCNARRLHKLPDDHAWSFCRDCRKEAPTIVGALRLHFDGAPLAPAELTEIAARPRPPGKPPSLVSNETAIRTTVGLDELFGPRLGSPRSIRANGSWTQSCAAGSSSLGLRSLRARAPTPCHCGGLASIASARCSSREAGSPRSALST